MVSSVLVSLLASVLLVQTAYGQCINSYVSQPQIASVQGSCGCGNNLVLSNNLVGAGALGCASSLLAPGIAQSNDLFTITSGSCATPNGISVIAENLEIAGPIAVSGSIPFVGAIGMNGALPSSGQATVQYSSAPGVGITNAGCGQGIAGNTVLGAGIGNNAIISNNLRAGNLAGYSLGGCGCV